MSKQELNPKEQNPKNMEELSISQIQPIENTVEFINCEDNQDIIELIRKRKSNKQLNENKFLNKIKMIKQNYDSKKNQNKLKHPFMQNQLERQTMRTIIKSRQNSQLKDEIYTIRRQIEIFKNKLEITQQENSDKADQIEYLKNFSISNKKVMNYLLQKPKEEVEEFLVVIKQTFNKKNKIKF